MEGKYIILILFLILSVLVFKIFCGEIIERNFADLSNRNECPDGKIISSNWHQYRLTEINGSCDWVLLNRTKSKT